MSKNAAAAQQTTEVENLTPESPKPAIIEAYKELNEKVDTVLEKISARKKKIK